MKPQPPEDEGPPRFGREIYRAQRRAGAVRGASATTRSTLLPPEPQPPTHEKVKKLDPALFTFANEKANALNGISDSRNISHRFRAFAQHPYCDWFLQVYLFACHKFGP